MRKKVKEKKIELKDIWILALTIIGPIIAFIPITMLGPLFVVIGVVLYTLYATIQAMNQKFNLLTIILIYGTLMIISFVIAYNLRNCVHILNETYDCPIDYFIFPRFMARTSISIYFIPLVTYMVASIKKIRKIKVGMIIILLVGLLSFCITKKVSENIIPFAEANYAAKY